MLRLILRPLIGRNPWYRVFEPQKDASGCCSKGYYPGCIGLSGDNIGTTVCRAVYRCYIGLRDITPMKENPMEEEMENEMETGFARRFIGIMENRILNISPYHFEVYLK